MKIFALLLIPCLLMPVSVGSRAGSFAPEATNDNTTTLFAQAARRLLNREFPGQNISYLLLEARTGALIASRWEHPEAAIPLGSLVKPFTALAYGEQHEFHFPRHICRGTSTGCWLPRGHGTVDLASAIAYSCNSYFRALTANLTAAEVSPTAIRFGLQPPPAGTEGLALAGLGNHWLVAPLNLARAYLELVRRRDQPGVSLIVDGMAKSAQEGTAAEVGHAMPHPGALTKTGTAACTHHVHAPGDGFTIAMVPAGQPQILLLVRVHGVPGAQAAKTAGQMLRRLEE